MVAVDGADDATDFVVEEEEDGDYQAGDDGNEYPFYRQMPELDEECRAIRACWTEGGADG